MKDKVKIAGVQTNPKLMANKENLKNILASALIAAENGADLVVFPECALTGYVFTSREEAMPYTETIPGPFTKALNDRCRELNIHIAAGLLEKDGDKLYNSAVLVGPSGLIGKYRKIHLPFLGVDRFTDHGDKPFQVYETPIGNIGLLICFDCNFPESCRIMALKGADILVLTTNWPEGRQKVAQYVVVTRAFENKVHVVAVDRVGSERGGGFIGLSKIVSAAGDVLVEASSDKEEIIYAEVSLEDARQKRIVYRPGEFEVDLMNDRRPEFYSPLTEASQE
jgi:predicted amidohydrolase